MSLVNFLYNPERKGRRQLIEEFVIRQDILDQVMDDLRASPMRTPEQHYLLVGQRGTGKTTLLHRIRYAIEDEVSLNKWLIPIVLTEEQYNIGELVNLWETIGQVLEDYYDFRGLLGKMEASLSSPKYGEMSWEILEEALDKQGKKLVLLIDNIGDLLKKLSELEVRGLRRILQTKPQIRLIAASPLYLESILDYKQPLFEFFKILRLEDLNSKDTKALLQKLGEINDETTKIDRIIKETPGRIETLRTLTGGVPRTIALMFNIFIEYEHETSYRDLERILDAVTPLYKHRMDDLPPQQQKIVDAVARAWDPIGVKTLKEKLRIESKAISAQLRQLEKNQVIQKLETRTKNHDYILRERFFNIWYLMRYGRKDDRQRVLWLVKFLESWCTDEEMVNRIAAIVEGLKNKNFGGDYLEFLGEVYTSISRLSLPAKLLLKENVAPKYAKNIKFNIEEINAMVKQAFEKESYVEAMDWMARINLLSDENKIVFIQKIANLIKTDTITINKIVSAVKEHTKGISNRAKQVRDRIDLYNDNGSTPIEIEELKIEAEYCAKEIRIVFMDVGIISYLIIEIASGQNQFEIAIKVLEVLLGLAYSHFKHGNSIMGIGGETLFLLLGIRSLYSNRQIHSLRRLFADGSIEGENGKIPYSEFFNPIYLAINSLDPDYETINLAPEKAGVVKQIRDFLLQGQKN